MIQRGKEILERNDTVKTRESLMRIMMFFIVIINLVNLVTLPIPYRVSFDKTIAEDILKAAYKPLEDFVKAGVSIDSDELLLVSSGIRNEEDFIKLFNNKVNNRLVEGFFEDIVVENQGVLYIDRKVYIPNIHAVDSKLTSSYIKKKTRSLYSFITGDNHIEEEILVIKERWKISGEWHRRSNYFVKNESGEWVLDRFNGTSLYGFVEASHNPWSY